MRRLILFRHAKTVASVPAGDHARPLTPRGVSEAASAALRLSASGVPDFALVSDARRARESFDRVVEALGHEIEHRFEPRLYGATADEIQALVAQMPDGVRSLMVIGHNPGLGDLARRLSADGPAQIRRDLDAHFPTAAFVIIALSAPDWAGVDQGGTLDLFAAPRDEKPDRASSHP